MSLEVALPVAYAASMAGFFAFVGRRNGFWWVAVPLIAGAGASILLLVLQSTESLFFTPMALLTVFIPVATAYFNREIGYRWWPSFSVNRRLMLAWAVTGGVLLLGAVTLLIGLTFFSR